MSGKEEKKHAGAAHGLPRAQESAPKRLKIVTRQGREMEIAVPPPQPEKKQPMVPQRADGWLPVLTPGQTVSLLAQMAMSIEVNGNTERAFHQLDAATKNGRRLLAYCGDTHEGKQVRDTSDVLVRKLIERGLLSRVAIDHLVQAQIHIGTQEIVGLALALDFETVEYFAEKKIVFTAALFDKFQLDIVPLATLEKMIGIVAMTALLFGQVVARNRGLYTALGYIARKCFRFMWPYVEPFYAMQLQHGLELCQGASTVPIGTGGDPYHGNDYKRINFSVYDLMRPDNEYKQGAIYTAVEMCRAAAHPLIMERVPVSDLIAIIFEYRGFTHEAHDRTPDSKKRYEVVGGWRPEFNPCVVDRDGISARNQLQRERAELRPALQPRSLEFAD
jgi:hypothetical protein